MPTSQLRKTLLRTGAKGAPPREQSLDPRRGLVLTVHWVGGFLPTASPASNPRVAGSAQVAGESHDGGV